MPKQNRKRKLEKSVDLEFETAAPKNKYKHSKEKAEEEEQQLTHILFGGASSFLKSLEEAEKETGTNGNIDSGVGEEDSDESNERERKPAWTDDEDDGIDVEFALTAQRRSLPHGGVNERKNKYTNLLKHRFLSAFGTPKWASLNKNKEHTDDSDEEILQTCGFVKQRSGETLSSGMLEFKKVKDLNCETYSEGPSINCIEFNTASSVALVAGNAGIASLYAVDGKRNNKLHSIAFENYPILCAKFSHSGQEAILGSRHSHIFSYDLMAAKAIRIPLPFGLTQFKKFTVSPDSKFIAAAGTWGEVHLLSCMSKEKIATLKQDSNVTALEFNPSSNLLYGHSDTGEITIWDVNMRRVKHKLVDEGCIQGSKLAIAPSNQFLATGSEQGVVNLYDVTEVLRSKTPNPVKSILNLTTRITDLKFNSTSEILALSSVDIENSVKLFHVGSGTVFSNFPNFSTKFGHINVMNFSPNSGYVAFGNKKSTVSLYRLKHFKNY